jgi:hypothetical protein
MFVALTLILLLPLKFLIPTSHLARPMSLAIRSAQSSDLEALTEIGIAAFPLEPQWPYRYPYREEYPEDHYNFTKIRYSEWLSAASTPVCEIMVVEAPSIEDPKVKRVVSLSIWRLPLQFEDLEDTHKCSLILDSEANRTVAPANPLYLHTRNQ